MSGIQSCVLIGDKFVPLLYPEATCESLPSVHRGEFRLMTSDQYPSSAYHALGSSLSSLQGPSLTEPGLKGPPRDSSSASTTSLAGAPVASA